MANVWIWIKRGLGLLGVALIGLLVIFFRKKTNAAPEETARAQKKEAEERAIEEIHIEEEAEQAHAQVAKQLEHALANPNPAPEDIDNLRTRIQRMERDRLKRNGKA